MGCSHNISYHYLHTVKKFQISMEYRVHHITNHLHIVKLNIHTPHIKARVESLVPVLKFMLTGKSMDTAIHMIIKCSKDEHKFTVQHRYIYIDPRIQIQILKSYYMV